MAVRALGSSQATSGGLARRSGPRCGAPKIDTRTTDARCVKNTGPPGVNPYSARCHFVNGTPMNSTSRIAASFNRLRAVLSYWYRGYLVLVRSFIVPRYPVRWKFGKENLLMGILPGDFSEWQLTTSASGQHMTTKLRPDECSPRLK